LDRVHITYLDMTDDQLLYITDEGGRWASSIVDAEGDVGSYSSIFVDEDFTVHIAYYDASLHALKYANDADGWDIEVVDNATHVGKAPALAVDSFGDAHIVYWDESQGILKYASDVGGEWRSIILEGTTEVGMVSSIAVDSDDHVHVAYLDNDLGYLVYANNSDGWDDLRLDTSGNVEEGNAMAIGPSDVVHIAYIKNGTLIHAYQSGNQWVFENVMDDVSSGISMKITSEGDVRIACFDDTLGDLIVLSNQGGAWEAASIDETGNAGFDTALVMDEEDLERLVYTHQVGGVQLGYAMKDSGIWLMSAFDDLNVGEQVSLAIDGFGRMHITYYDATEGDLGYIVSLTRPTAPLGLEASGVENAVELAWEAPATDGGSEVLSYRIYSGDSADSLTLLDEVSGEARNYTDGNITIASTRYYAIEAVSAEGTGVRTEVISAMAVARPTAPRDVDVNAGDGKVKLTWSAPASDGGVDVILYNVYRSDTPSDPVLIGNTTSMSYTDNDLTNGEKYYYWISAVNDVGEGDSSAVVDATPSASDGVDDTLIIAIAIVAVIAVVLIALYLLRSAGKL
jgi:hypothetical protein